VLTSKILINKESCLGIVENLEDTETICFRQSRILPCRSDNLDGTPYLLISLVMLTTCFKSGFKCCLKSYFYKLSFSTFYITCYFVVYWFFNSYIFIHMCV